MYICDSTTLGHFQDSSNHYRYILVTPETTMIDVYIYDRTTFGHFKTVVIIIDIFITPFLKQ